MIQIKNSQKLYGAIVTRVTNQITASFSLTIFYLNQIDYFI